MDARCLSATTIGRTIKLAKRKGTGLNEINFASEWEHESGIQSDKVDVKFERLKFIIRFIFLNFVHYYRKDILNSKLG